MCQTLANKFSTDRQIANLQKQVRRLRQNRSSADRLCVWEVTVCPNERKCVCVWRNFTDKNETRKQTVQDPLRTFVTTPGTKIPSVLSDAQ